MAGYDGEWDKKRLKGRPAAWTKRGVMKERERVVETRIESPGDFKYSFHFSLATWLLLMRAHDDVIRSQPSEISFSPDSDKARSHTCRILAFAV